MLSQPLHSCVSVFLTLSPFNALFLICHPPLSFTVILLSLSASSISISSRHLFFFSTFLSPFQVLFLLHFFCCLYLYSQCQHLSPNLLTSIIPSSQFILPSLLSIAAPSQIRPCSFVRYLSFCLLRKWFPISTSNGPFSSSFFHWLVAYLCSLPETTSLSVSLSLSRSFFFFFFSQWYYLGLPIPGWSALLSLPPPSFPHPLPVLIYSHAEIDR